MFDCFACSPKVSVGVLEPLLSSEAVHINNTVELEQSMLNIPPEVGCTIPHDVLGSAVTVTIAQSS